MKEADIRPADLHARLLELARQDAERMLSEKAAFEPVACPACGSSDEEEAFVKQGYRYALCRGCGSLFQNPRPTDEQLGRYYSEGLSVKFWCTDFFRKTSEARRERMFRPRALRAAELASGSLVDVGSGYGVFLEEAAKCGAFSKVIGVEPGPQLAQVCRDKGFQILEKRLEDVRPGEAAADLATAFEVLEHVRRPVEFLKALKHVLRPGGRCLLTTLCCDGFDIQVLWERSDSVFPPQHINLLSAKGFRALFERAGLKLVSLRTPGKLDVDILAGRRERDDWKPPRFVETLLDSQPDVRQDFQAFLARNGLSSHVELVAEA